MTTKTNLIKIFFRFLFSMMIGSLLSGFLSPVLAKDQKGELLALSCTSCHGTYGLSPGAMPTLYGKSMKYIEQSMQKYRDGQRPSTMMHRIAKGYTIEEIRLISEYFASLSTEKSLK